MDQPKGRRSRTGCVTCRTRKVRCDEQHPVCRACTRLHLTCSYLKPGESTSKGTGRKNARPRRSKFRVRFVNADSSQLENHKLDADTPTVRPFSSSSSPVQVSETSPASSDGIVTSCQPKLHQATMEMFPEPPLSPPSWPDEGIPQPQSRDAAVSLNDSAHLEFQDRISPGHPTALNDVEGWLGSIDFQSDFGLLWATVPGLDDYSMNLGGGIDTLEGAANTQLPAEDTHRTQPSSALPARSIDARQMVTIRPEDTEPLQHYLSTMIQFAKIRSSASDNIYCYIFTNMALTHAPLYEAILAWAALHLAHIKLASTKDAELRYLRAAELLYDDMQAAEHVDLTLVTVWILLQYELFLAEGVERFIRLLNYVADVVEGVFQHHHVTDVKRQLGPVGIRVLMWLSAYDGRAAPFGNSCRLLRCLKMHPFIYGMIDNNGAPSVDHAVAPIEFGTRELKACLRLALRLNIVKGSCILLGHWPRGSIEYESARTALCSSLQTVHQELQEADIPAAKLAMRVALGDMSVHTKINTVEFNWMQLSATYFSCVILYRQHCPAPSVDGSSPDLDLSSWPEIRECAARIIRLSRHVTLSRPNSPQAIWPQMLFQAGMEIDDPIYQAWVLGTLAQAEAWGPNLRKTRQLLERIVECRREVNAPVSMNAVMESMGAPFII